MRIIALTCASTQVARLFAGSFAGHMAQTIARSGLSAVVVSASGSRRTLLNLGLENDTVAQGLAAHIDTCKTGERNPFDDETVNLLRGYQDVSIVLDVWQEGQVGVLHDFGEVFQVRLLGSDPVDCLMAMGGKWCQYEDANQLLGMAEAMALSIVAEFHPNNNTVEAVSDLLNLAGAKSSQPEATLFMLAASKKLESIIAESVKSCGPADKHAIASVASVGFSGVVPPSAYADQRMVNIEAVAPSVPPVPEEPAEKIEDATTQVQPAESADEPQDVQCEPEHQEPAESALPPADFDTRLRFALHRMNTRILNQADPSGNTVANLPVSDPCTCDPFVIMAAAMWNMPIPSSLDAIELFRSDEGFKRSIAKTAFYTLLVNGTHEDFEQLRMLCPVQALNGVFVDKLHAGGMSMADTKAAHLLDRAASVMEVKRAQGDTAQS